MANHDPAVFERAAREVGFTGFGFYKENNFIHIDTGPKRTWHARWYDLDADFVELPKEAVLLPETPSEDKSLIGAVVGSGGAIAGLGSVVGSLGGLSPVAQVLAVGGLVVTVLAIAFIMRNQLKNFR